MRAKEPAAASPLALTSECLVLLPLFGVVFYCAFTSGWDIDVFWQLALGRLYYERGQVVLEDTFSALDPGRPFVPIQWAYELVIYGTHTLFGMEGVRGIHVAVIILSFVLFWATARLRMKLGAASALFLTTCLLALHADRFRVRADILNLVAWVVLLPIILDGKMRERGAARAFVAVAVFVWACFHGGGALLFLVATCVLPVGAILLALVRGDSEARREAKASVVWFLGSVLAPASLAPYFLRGNWTIFSRLDNTEWTTSEWYPAWHYLELRWAPLHDLLGLAPTLLLVACGILAFPVARALVRDRGRGLEADRLSRLGLALVLASLAQRAVRFAPYGALALLVLWPPMTRSPGEARQKMTFRAAGLGLVSTLVFALVVHHRFYFLSQGVRPALEQLFKTSSYDAAGLPGSLAQFLDENGFEGRLFTRADWGGFLLWQLYPKAKTLSDGRGNYSDDVALDLAITTRRVNFNSPETGPILDSIYSKYPVDAIVLKHPVWPRGYTVDPERFRLVYRDTLGDVWVRATPAGIAFLEKLDARARRRAAEDSAL